jgi:tetratricopeptide (TPR) repeat protein
VVTLRGPPLVLLCLMSCLASSGAWAQADVPLRLSLTQLAPRNDTIEAATKQVEAGDFEDAVRTIERGIEAELTDDQLAELYRLLGLSHLYLGNEDKARDAFEKLLQARPDYELPKSTPPKLRTLYARIKDDIRKRRVRPVTLTLTPVAQVPGGAAVPVDAHIDDLALGARARLFYRRAGAQAFSSTDFTKEKGLKGEFTATIPAFEVPTEDAAYEVEYYVEVADAAQRRLAGKGDPFNPLAFTVAAKVVTATVVESKPWYTNPWVWIGVGVGAAAITTGVVLVATTQQTATLPIKIQIDGMP